MEPVVLSFYYRRAAERAFVAGASWPATLLNMLYFVGVVSASRTCPVCPPMSAMSGSPLGGDGGSGETFRAPAGQGNFPTPATPAGIMPFCRGGAGMNTPRLNRQGLAPVTTKSTRRLPHWAAHQPLVPVRDGQIGAVALGHRGRVGLDLLPSVAGGIGAKRLRGSMCTGEPPTKAPKEV